jgi:hypothetical protein
VEGLSTEKPASKKKTSLVGITYLNNYNYRENTRAALEGRHTSHLIQNFLLLIIQQQ